MNKNLRLIIVIVLCFFDLSSDGQNLVLNGDFEKKGRVFPFNIRSLAGLSNWSSPGIGSTDFYKRNRSKIGAQSGNRFVGFGVFNPTRENSYRQEYLCGKLKKRLVKDQLYCLTFYLRNTQSKGVQYCMDSLDIYFSKRRLRATLKEYIKLKEFISTQIRNEFINDKEWVKITHIYKAKGDERFFTIGKFTRHFNFERVDFRTSRYPPSAYYFIDNISLVEADSNSTYLDDIDKSVIEIKQRTIVINDIVFDFGKSELSQNSLPALDTFINENSKKKGKFIVSGHTDSIGNDSFNTELSIARAKEIKQYLISSGIKGKRIKVKGMGSTSPIASNSTEEGRAQNRRVEITLIKN